MHVEWHLQCRQWRRPRFAAAWLCMAGLGCCRPEPPRCRRLASTENMLRCYLTGPESTLPAELIKASKAAMAALAPPHQQPTTSSYLLHQYAPAAECAFPPQQRGGVVPPAHRPPLPSGSQPAHPYSQAHRSGLHSGLTHGLQQQAAGFGGGDIPAGTCGSVPPPANVAPLPCYSGQPAPCFPDSSWQAYMQAVQAQAAGATYGMPAVCAEAAAAQAAAPPPWPTLAPHAGCYQLFHPSDGASNPAGAAALHPAAMQKQVAAAAVPADAGTSRKRTRRRPTARRSLLNLFDAAAVSEEACDLSEDSDSELARTCSLPPGDPVFEPLI